MFKIKRPPEEHTRRKLSSSPCVALQTCFRLHKNERLCCSGAKSFLSESTIYNRSKLYLKEMPPLQVYVASLSAILDLENVMILHMTPIKLSPFPCLCPY